MPLPSLTTPPALYHLCDLVLGAFQCWCNDGQRCTSPCILRQSPGLVPVAEVCEPLPIIHAQVAQRRGCDFPGRESHAPIFVVNTATQVTPVLPGTVPGTPAATCEAQPLRRSTRRPRPRQPVPVYVRRDA